MIETAIFMPLVLLGILFFIWLGVTFNARTSLEAAVPRSIMLAITRGVNERVGTDIIQDVQRWHDDPADVTDRLGKFLAKDVLFDPDALNYYQQHSTTVFDNRALNEMPQEYIYAQLYVNEAMKQSVGSVVKYPCAGQPGCLNCAFLNPTTLDTITPYGDEPPRRKLGLECSYQLSSVLLDPIFSLLRLILGDAAIGPMIIRQRQFMDVPAL